MNKVLSKVLTGAMGLILIGTIGIQVKANNYTDTYFEAYLDDYYGISEAYTLGRYKADYSSGYVRNISSSYDGSTSFTLVASDGDESSNYYEDFSLYKYEISPNEHAYLKNYVKENGYDYAAVKVEPGSQFSMSTYFAESW